MANGGGRVPGFANASAAWVGGTAGGGGGAGGGAGRPAGGHIPTASIRNRWVGKQGRIRREGMGKRVNYCARSVVTCDSHLSAGEIMVPWSIVHRLTAPTLVLAHNLPHLLARMRHGEVLFVQRSTGPGRMRSVNHLAVQNLVLSPGDCVLRGGSKYRFGSAGAAVPPSRPEDVPLPVQSVPGGPRATSGWTLCFGDRVRLASTGAVVDPLRCISWPDLHVGDAVLVVPRVGTTLLVNRQPTLVAGRGRRRGYMPPAPPAAAGVHAGHADARRAQPLLLDQLRPGGGAPRRLRRRRPGRRVVPGRRAAPPPEINLHFPQSANVEAELEGLLGVPEQIVTGQSSAPVVRLIQDAVVVAFWLTDPQRATHGPLCLAQGGVFEQLASDMQHFPTFGDLLRRRAEIAREWDAFRTAQPDHPTVRALTAAGLDYNRTGHALLSLCLPSGCTFLGPTDAAAAGPGGRLAAAWHRGRHLPRSSARVEVRRGLYLQGWLNSSVLTGKGGLLLHIYLYHGPRAGLALIDGLQRLTTSASLYRYNQSVGLDDCLLPDDVRLTARQLLGSEVDTALARSRSAESTDAPYRMEERENIVNRLIGARARSEAFLVDRVMRPRRAQRGEGSTDLTDTNSIGVLSMLGTKGSVSNLVPAAPPPLPSTPVSRGVGVGGGGAALPQCTHSLGQQIINDGRVPVSDFGRVFPHDPRFQNNPVSQGLLWRESFIEGLSPLAFFVHAAPGPHPSAALDDGVAVAIAGREALVEGATSTAQDWVGASSRGAHPSGAATPCGWG